MEEKITKELLEQSIEEHKNFISMVCENKYGHKDIKDVIEGVINYCNIEDEDQKDLLRSGKFIPAGSILSKCNTDSKGSFSNCYFTPIKNDSIEAIFECQKELARTFSYRGGSGVDITVLRPCDEKVNNAAKQSSGAVSFMPSFSELTKTIAQKGRRGALIITLDIRHPDALKFIWSKAKPEEVFETDIFTGRYPTIDSANISLKISDSFMKAVENDEDFTFCFPDIDENKEKYNNEWNGDYDKWFESGGKFKEYQTLKAKDILSQVSEAAWICGDPGIWFMDTAQRKTFGTYIDERLKPIGVNPCGEQGLAAYNNCLLGAFVLPYYYKDNIFLREEFENDVMVATRLMNYFSDINTSEHPLQKQREEDEFGKRIGMEITGFGDLCALMGFKYGDINAINLAEYVTHSLLFHTIRESCNIAIETCRPCRAMESQEARESFLDRLKDTDVDLKQDILEYGLANTAFTTIGPCGSISIVSDNCSSGIEPIFKFSYKRKNRIDEKEYEFIHLPAAKYMLENLNEFEGLTLTQAKQKLNYIEADEIDWRKRIDIQSALQKNIDASISSTINLPNNCTKETIQDIYRYAWKKNLKGITVFRDGCKEGVLSSTGQKFEKQDTFPELFEKELLNEETAVRHRVNWKGSKLYINVSIDDDGNPIEVFTKLPKNAGMNGDDLFNPVLWQERTSLWDSLCRVISMSLRFNIPVEEIIDQLDKSTYSMVDAAGILKRILSKYIPVKENEDGENFFEECPECGEKSYRKEGGCEKCDECGFSRCG